MTDLLFNWDCVFKIMLITGLIICVLSLICIGFTETLELEREEINSVHTWWILGLLEVLFSSGYFIFYKTCINEKKEVKT